MDIARTTSPLLPICRGGEIEPGISGSLAYTDGLSDTDNVNIHLQTSGIDSTLVLNNLSVGECPVVSQVLPDEFSNSQRPKLFLRGPLRLVALDGSVRTPKGGVRKALLALLVLSDTRSRGRLRLQNMLWENSTEKQGAASLRTALCILRSEFRIGLGFDPIRADSQSVRIDTSRIWIDVYDQPPSSFAAEDSTLGCEVLEGLNLRGAGGEDFEDWLREQRSFWSVALVCPPASSATVKVGESVEAGVIVQSCGQEGMIEQNRNHIGVGLLPVTVLSGGTAGIIFGDSVLDAIATDLAILSLIEIYDYRDGDSEAFAVNHGLGPRLLLRVRLSLERDQFALHLSAHVASTQQLVIGGSVTGDIGERLTLGHYAVSGFIAQNVDRLLNWLAQPENIHRTIPNTPYHALNTMFRVEDNAPGVAERMLMSAADESDAPIYDGLMAYLETFHVGEHWGQWNQDVVRRTEDLVKRALSRNPLEGLTLCTAGHALGYTLHDYPISGDILRRSVQLSPTLAICWDHLALHYLYLGEYERAMEAARHAIQLGAYSPLRFTYETTVCMIATLSGDYAKAAHYGQRALSRRPHFGAALRYMAVSLSHLDRLDESRALVERLQSLDPTFSLEWIQQDRFALTDECAKRRVRSALQRVGVHQ